MILLCAVIVLSAASKITVTPQPVQSPVPMCHWEYFFKVWGSLGPGMTQDDIRWHRPDKARHVMKIFLPFQLSLDPECPEETQVSAAVALTPLCLTLLPICGWESGPQVWAFGCYHISLDTNNTPWFSVYLGLLLFLPPVDGKSWWFPILVVMSSSLFEYTELNIQSESTERKLVSK